MKLPVLVAALLLTGCTAYVKPGVSHDEAQADYQDCTQANHRLVETFIFMSGDSFGGFSGYVDAAAVEACMRTKGYQRQEGPGIAPAPSR